MALEITCVGIDAGESQISMLGGLGWFMSATAVVKAIEQGAEYFITVDGDRVDLVVESLGAQRRLRSDPAKAPANNLLSLPPCPH